MNYVVLTDVDIDSVKIFAGATFEEAEEKAWEYVKREIEESGNEYKGPEGETGYEVIWADFVDEAFLAARFQE